MSSDSMDSCLVMGPTAQMPRFDFRDPAAHASPTEIGGLRRDVTPLSSPFATCNSFQPSPSPTSPKFRPSAKASYYTTPPTSPIAATAQIAKASFSSPSMRSPRTFTGNVTPPVSPNSRIESMSLQKPAKRVLFEGSMSEGRKKVRSKPEEDENAFLSAPAVTTPSTFHPYFRRPVPNFENFNPYVKSSQSSGPPPTPRKASRIAPQFRHTPQQETPSTRIAKQATEIATHGIIHYNGALYSVQPLAGAKGSYAQAYTVRGDTAIDPRYTNEDLLVKTFHETCVNCNRGSLESYMTNSLKQYNQLVELKLPVAEILNASTAKEDGYYIVKRIPHTVDTSSWVRKTDKDGKMEEYKTFTELDEHVRKVLEQAKHLFNERVRLHIEIDLLPQNLRLTEDGKLVIIDFMEETEDDSLDGEFTASLTQALSLWACGNPNILNYLIQDFSSIDSALSIDIENFFTLMT